MCLQMLWLTELLFTLRTAEWFLISMKSFMGLQITWWTEFLLTLWTAECLVISMNSFMCCDRLKFFSHFEQLNDFSSVWIISCVFKCCDCQIHESWKYSAVRAHMWLKKVGNVTNNDVIKCVIRALSICTSKNSVFPDFLIRLNRKSGFFSTLTWPPPPGLI